MDNAGWAEGNCRETRAQCQDLDCQHAHRADGVDVPGRDEACQDQELGQTTIATTIKIEEDDDNYGDA
ncbi:unnamed protein product [Rhizoctonia solani]|uniref:Uncharacterized protein n=1 Tax=Rhizoctonia solani TaxID=456999 RepID=A0A8H2X2D5_9AGAM|nr:unnamed protein product [Rhizoctonia solani]CAE6491995.1 unnamed protein product [Rhizoctonia solani]